MQKQLSYILLAFVISMLAAACSDDVDIPGGDGGDVAEAGYANLVLSVESGRDVLTAPATRSPFDGFDNELDKWGISGENMETLRILIIDGSNVVECNRKFDLNNQMQAGKYEFQVRKDDTKRVFLIANEEQYSVDVPGMEITGVTTKLTKYLTDLKTGKMVNLDEIRRLTIPLRYNSPDDRGQSLKTPLLITAEYSEEIGSEAQTIERTYDIHRAAVKYSFRIVNLSPYAHKLKKLRIDRICNREYMFPDCDWGVNELGHVVMTDYRTPAYASEGYYEYVYDTPLSLPSNMEEAVSALTSPIYVPEGLHNEEPQKVSLNIDGADLDVWCELLWRMPGETEASARPMVDLPRNSHVVVNITILDNNAISLIADVQPYALAEADPWFGFERDENDNIIMERREDGTMIVIINGSEVHVDADGDRIIKVFEDGSVLCEEIIYKDYIHSDSDVDYSYVFEKDAPGGNIILARVSGSKFHEDEGIDGEEHVHGPADPPIFVITKNNEIKRVEIVNGKPQYFGTDSKGDKLIQVNGYQYREKDEMAEYIGTYLVELSDGKLQLRRSNTGEDLVWNSDDFSEAEARMAQQLTQREARRMANGCSRSHRKSILRRIAKGASRQLSFKS